MFGSEAPLFDLKAPFFEFEEALIEHERAMSRFLHPMFSLSGHCPPSRDYCFTSKSRCLSPTSPHSFPRNLFPITLRSRFGQREAHTVKENSR
jgi:hypothetical protein